MEALENLKVWKCACRLSVNIYNSLSCCKEYSFKDQITRSALSIPSNIAEGYERGTGLQRIQYLKIAKGSCGELYTQLMIGRAAGFISKKTAQELERDAKEITKMLYGLIKHYQT